MAATADCKHNSLSFKLKYTRVRLFSAGKYLLFRRKLFSNDFFANAKLSLTK